MLIGAFLSLAGLAGNPWAGLSGAVLWCGGWLMIGVGIVAANINRLRIAKPSAD